VVEHALVVVSGLPASGKTTVGGLLSERLRLPLIDKDAILEALFDTLGSPNREARERLSRASDEVLFSLAASSTTSILVNWWNPETAPTRLRRITPSVVQVFCACPVEVAVKRFEARNRHPGHHDPRRSPPEVEAQVHRVRETFRGPLRLRGPLVRVDTTRTLDRDALAAEVRASLEEVRAQCRS
jgi:thymidylate kinase